MKKQKKQKYKINNYIKYIKNEKAARYNKITTEMLKSIEKKELPY